MDLASLVQRFGPLPPERAVAVLRQACRSLGEAHAAGLLHRDIKPQNLFLCRLGLDFDVVKVLDFGLVKSLDEGATQLTAEGTLTGTPAYMPPERVLGAAADERSDLYSLGCVAYWMLTGRPVFTGEPMTVHDPPRSDRAQASLDDFRRVPFLTVSSRSSWPASRKRRRSAHRRRSICGASSARSRSARRGPPSAPSTGGASISQTSRACRLAAIPAANCASSPFSKSQNNRGTRRARRNLFGSACSACSAVSCGESDQV